MQKKKVVKREMSPKQTHHRNTIHFKMDFKVKNNKDEVVESIVEEKVTEIVPEELDKPIKKSKKQKTVENNELND